MLDFYQYLNCEPTTSKTSIKTTLNHMLSNQHEYVTLLCLDLASTLFHNEELTQIYDTFFPNYKAASFKLPDISQAFGRGATQTIRADKLGEYVKNYIVSRDLQSKEVAALASIKIFRDAILTEPMCYRRLTGKGFAQIFVVYKNDDFLRREFERNVELREIFLRQTKVHGEKDITLYASLACELILSSEYATQLSEITLHRIAQKYKNKPHIIAKVELLTQSIEQQSEVDALSRFSLDLNASLTSSPDMFKKIVGQPELSRQVSAKAFYKAQRKFGERPDIKPFFAKGSLAYQKAQCYSLIKKTPNGFLDLDTLQAYPVDYYIDELYPRCMKSYWDAKKILSSPELNHYFSTRQWVDLLRYHVEHIDDFLVVFEQSNCLEDIIASSAMSYLHMIADVHPKVLAYLLQKPQYYTEMGTRSMQSLIYKYPTQENWSLFVSLINKDEIIAQCADIKLRPMDSLNAALLNLKHDDLDSVARFIATLFRDNPCAAMYQIHDLQNDGIRLTELFNLIHVNRELFEQDSVTQALTQLAMTYTQSRLSLFVSSQIIPDSIGFLAVAMSAYCFYLSASLTVLMPLVLGSCLAYYSFEYLRSIQQTHEDTLSQLIAKNAPVSQEKFAVSFWGGLRNAEAFAQARYDDMVDAYNLYASRSR